MANLTVNGVCKDSVEAVRKAVLDIMDSNAADAVKIAAIQAVGALIHQQTIISGNYIGYGDSEQ